MDRPAGAAESSQNDPCLSSPANTMPRNVVSFIDWAGWRYAIERITNFLTILHIDEGFQYAESSHIPK